MKTFFDGVFIDKNKLEEADIKYPIKLEYFKTTGEEENVETRFGIEVVKTEYLDNSVRVESKEVKNITDDFREAEEILTLLKNNEVTPIAVEDVLQDLIGNIVS